MGDWDPTTGLHPYPPANVQVVSSFMSGCFDIRWDDPAIYSVVPAHPGDYETIQAMGYINIYNTPNIAGTATGTIHVLSAPIAAGAKLTIAGFELTAIHGARTSGADDFNSDLPTATLLAMEIIAALNDVANSFHDLILSVATDGLITIAAVDEGSDGNLITISTDTEYLAPSGSFLSGGVDADTITIGGIVLTPVYGNRTSGSNDYSIDGGTNAVASSIASAIGDSANSFTGIVTAKAEGNHVALTAVPIGSLGNDITLATTADVSVITVSADTLENGSDPTSCQGQSNITWSIVGVNIYRSDTGERGPYIRLNNLPIGGLFYRDCTINKLVTNEVIRWDGNWISRGDAANNRLWRFRTRYKPIVKSTGQAIPADSPYDVVVTIDGVTVPVDAVSGRAGEIDLINVATYDPSTEKTIPAVIPTETSAVTVTYHYQSNLVRTDLDNISKIHYRVTTVALDPTGQNPSGYVETPLGYAPPNSPINVETMDYIWREAIRRNRWILEQGGERVKVFIRRVTGVPCRCQWQQSDPRLFEVTKQPVNGCLVCYGSGYVGGFEGPIDLIIAPEEAERAVRQTPVGRRLESTYEVWTGPTPLLSQRDFIVKQNGERFSIGPVRRTQVRGLVLQQAFTIQYIDECDIRYSVPLGNLYELPWPETRYTRPEEAPCIESDPYPIGFDYQATPMETESPKIPDGREIRGRTPVWQNLHYGGKSRT